MVLAVAEENKRFSERRVGKLAHETVSFLQAFKQAAARSLQAYFFKYISSHIAKNEFHDIKKAK